MKRCAVLLFWATGCGGALAESDIGAIAGSDLQCRDVRIVDVGSNNARASGCGRSASYHYGMNDHRWHIEKEERRYELSDGKIRVTDQAGERTVDVPCSAQALARKDDRIEIACRDAKVAVFSLAAPEEPAFVEMHWAPPTPAPIVAKPHERDTALIAGGAALAATSVAAIIGGMVASLSACPLVSLTPSSCNAGPGAAVALAGLGGLIVGGVMIAVGAQ